MDNRSLHVFEVDLEDISKKLDIQLDKLIRKVALDVFTGIVKKTPVDTGTLRASWQIGVNEAPERSLTISNGTLDKSGASALAMHFARPEISFVQAGDVVIISNHLPYALVAEYGLWKGPTMKVTAAGYSRKAPAGMVRVTLIRVRNKLLREIEEIKL